MTITRIARFLAAALILAGLTCGCSERKGKLHSPQSASSPAFCATQAASAPNPESATKSGSFVGQRGLGGDSEYLTTAKAQEWDIKQNKVFGREWLVIALSDERDLIVQRSRDSKKIESVMILLKDRPGSILEYTIEGPYQKPDMNYGGELDWVHKGLLNWRDLNADGRWDIKHEQKRAWIRVGEMWVKAKIVDKEHMSLLDGLVTDDGVVYKFDPESGEWIRSK